MKNTNLEEITIQNIYKVFVRHKLWIFIGGVFGICCGFLFYHFSPKLYKNEVYISGGYLQEVAYPEQKLLNIKLKDPEFQKLIFDKSSNFSISTKENLIAAEILNSSKLVQPDSNIMLTVIGQNSSDNELILKKLSSSIVNYQNEIIFKEIEYINQKINYLNEYLYSLRMINNENENENENENYFNLLVSIKNTRTEILKLKQSIEEEKFTLAFIKKSNNASQLISISLYLSILRGFFWGALAGFILRIIYFKLLNK
jgi:hypothetical protein